MMPIDPRTLIIVTSVVAAAMAFSLVWVIGVDRERGLGLWALSLILLSIAMGMIATGGTPPAPGSLATRTALVGLSYGLRYYALSTFFEAPRRPVLLWGPAVLEVFLVVALAAHPFTASGLVDTTRFAQSALLIWVVVHRGSVRATRSQGLMVVGLSIFAAVFLIRGVALLTAPAHFGPHLARTTIQSMTWLASFLGTMLSSFALVLMYRERVTREVARQKEALEATLARAKRLEGLLSICMHCKKIHGESDSWLQVEKYVSDHSDARFSHSICPECYRVHHAEVEA